MKKIYLIIILLAAAQCSSGQSLYNRHQVFKTILDGGIKINPYYLSGNPAYLEYDGTDQLLLIESDFKNEQGELKKFFEPGTERLYNLNFSGKKSLEHNQIFKGLFSIYKLERSDWNWLAVRDYETGSPFLLGDSTSGRTRYNGTIMNAQYSVNFTSSFSGGFSITYNVDEGMKEVSPRPTSDHRDIDLSLGAAYRVTDNFSAGVSLQAIDQLEQINYREDEAAIYKETFLIKNRGYNYPLIISKKSETRISYHNGYFANSDFFYNSNAFTASVYLNGGIRQITIKEDLSDPRSEGYWKSNIFGTGLGLRFRLTDDWNTGLLYKYELENMWAKHPSYYVRIMDKEIKSHKIAAGVEHNISSSLTAGFEATTVLLRENLNDYYGNISSSYSAKLLGFSAGLDYRWSDLLRTFISAGYGDRSHSDLFEAVPADFINTSRSVDLIFAGTDYLASSIDFKAEFNTSFPGIVNVYISYLNLSADKKDINAYAGSSRTFFNAAVEFKIKVY